MCVTKAVSRPAARALASIPSSSWAASSALRRSFARPSVVVGQHALCPSAVGAIGRSSLFFSTSMRLGKAESAATDNGKPTENDTTAGETFGSTDGTVAAEGADAEPLSREEVEKLQLSVKEKDAKIKELTDVVLYAKADMANILRRTEEEKESAKAYAITKLARDLTSSLDILTLALRSVPEPLRKAPAEAASPEDPRKAIAELYSGIDLTYKSTLDMLKAHGVTVFDPTGEKFDPQEHEAMYQAPVPGKEPGTVLECSKVGFRIKDRILRAAQVGVVQEAQS